VYRSEGEPLALRLGELHLEMLEHAVGDSVVSARCVADGDDGCGHAGSILTHMQNLPIGVFDSGLGGLTVAREIERTLPNESLVYLGDTARFPYGPRTRRTCVVSSSR